MKITLNIKGIHCNGCKQIIEEELSQFTGITSININLKTNQAEIDYTKETSIEKIIEKINSQHYEASLEKSLDKNVYYLVGVVATFIILFSMAEYFGWFSVMENLNNQNLSYGLIFIIGLLASLHCVGMCGGLIMSYAAKSDQSNWPHWQYNIGRIISYSLIGALLGGLGSFFNINPMLSGILMIGAGLFMLSLGLSFVFDFKLPSLKIPYLKSNSTNGPLMIGLLTGFMPCGPLQAMQIYALGTGNSWHGGLSMFVYALGTTPLLFGFGKFINRINQTKISLFLKLSGVIIIMMGLIMANRGSLNFDYGFTDTPPTQKNNYLEENTNKNAQIIKMNVTYNGYTPNTIHIKTGVPVKWIINVKEMSSCTSAIILHGYNIEKDLQYGENIIEFTPKETGEIKFSCGMQMVWGKFIVDSNNIIEDSGTCLSNQECTTK